MITAISFILFIIFLCLAFHFANMYLDYRIGWIGFPLAISCEVISILSLLVFALNLFFLVAFGIMH